jgi:hypothetical protein
LNITQRGTLLALLQSETWDFDPARGYIHRLTYKGASQGLMLALQQDYVRAGIACRLVYNQGGTATFEVEDATMQYTIDVWQLLGNEESRDGLTHPNLAAAIIANGDDPDKLIASARQHLEQKDDPPSLFAVGGDFHFAPAALQRFYSLQTRGSTEYWRGQYVLRHTTNAPNRWDSNIADFGVDRIYTPAQLLSEVQNSGLWIVPLPGRLAYKLASIPTPTFLSDYQWGWKKGASTETTAANNRVEIATEYVLEQWSTDYYAPL